MLEQPAVNNYAFILNVRSFVDFESMEVVPGHVIRRATEAEITEIRETITFLAGNRLHVPPTWEIRWDDAHTHTEELPRDLWRYFIVAFRGNNETMSNLSTACCLSSAEPDVGPTMMRGVVGGRVVRGPIHDPGKFFQSTEHPVPRRRGGIYRSEARRS